MSRVASTVAPPDAVMPKRHPKAPAAKSQIPSHFGYCFGCGELHVTGLHFKGIAGENLDLTGNFTVTERLIRTPAVTGRLETDFLLPVPVGRTLYIDARITGQAGRKIYTQAEGRLDSPTGEIAVKAAALFISVPMEHFIKNLTEQYKDHLTQHPELMAFVDPDFDINP